MYDNKIPGSRPGCEVVLKPHSPVNPGLIAFYDVFAVLSKWRLRVTDDCHWADVEISEVLLDI